MWDNFWERSWEVLTSNFPFLLEALKTTFILAFFGFVFGLILATGIAILATHKKPNLFVKIVNNVLGVYIWIIRGTPTLVMLLLMFFVILTPLRLPAMQVGILVFTMYGSAFMAEILRGAINGIDSGQLEAGLALGLGRFYVMYKIILPQAFKNATPALGNTAIQMVKDTSVVGFITLIDLTRAFQFIVIRTYDAIVPYMLLALIYLVIVLAMTLIIKLIEKVVFRHGK